jgi:L-alanine-DL-glutamate epimerase-like enolase superfamily enzyme
MGRRNGQPVYEMLGGRKRVRVPILWMLAAGDRDQDCDEARRKADLGFQAFKVKVGAGSGLDGVTRDLERATLARDVLGTGAQISADANQGYSRAEALAFVRAVEPSILDFFEQPVAGHDIEGMQDIARVARIPIGADEGIHSIDDIKHHAAACAAHGVSLKTIKLGGLADVMAAGTTTDALGMKVNLAGKIADSSIASAAIAHLSVALPQIDWGVSITNQYLAADVTARPLLVEAGHVSPPDAPGLGIAIDEERVASFAFKPDL